MRTSGIMPFPSSTRAEQVVTESEFNRHLDKLIYAIEEELDQADADVDCESTGGVLTITCEVNGSRIIVSRQPAILELWIAARSGGYHFGLEDGAFRCKSTGESLAELMSRVLSEQCQEPVVIALR